MSWDVGYFPVYSAVMLAEISGNINNTIIGAVIVGGAIAITKILDVWWANKRADSRVARVEHREDEKQDRENAREDKYQVFRLQEEFIKDLLGRIQVLEVSCRERDIKIQTLEIQHSQCEKDHAECKKMIEELKSDISSIGNNK